MVIRIPIEEPLAAFTDLHIVSVPDDLHGPSVSANTAAIQLRPMQKLCSQNQKTAEKFTSEKLIFPNKNH